MAEHIERLGKRIRERRKELGLTQGELARRLTEGNPDAAQISRWERGIHEPDPDRKEDIANALKTTVADLMAGPHAEREKGPTPDLLEMSNGRPATINAHMREQLERIERDLRLIMAHLGISAPAAEESTDIPGFELPAQDQPQDAQDPDEPASGEAS